LAIPGWDEYFFKLVDDVATRSKDPNTQIGSVIVGPDHEIRTTGYNSFPRGIRDDVPERLVRPNKYRWIEHAERNAIANAARVGTATGGCSIYIKVLPCMECGRAIIQAGIKEVVINQAEHSKYADTPKWAADFADVVEMFAEAQIKVRFV
jgi:dCMP deaminase